jgi:predicted phage terminase large subunit-like protein
MFRRFFLCAVLVMPTASQYEALLAEHPNVEAAIRPRWTAYIPHEPTPKQLAFLSLDGYREVFYGGAAGCGKSDALGMGALQYIDVPGYAAIIFRKTFADLRLPGALIDRSHQWLAETPAKWDTQQHTWYFPTDGEPAKLAFGYLEKEFDAYRYQGAEFQYIAFDELTQHWEEDYLYLFSRLRRLKDYPVPLRMRAASNPGGRGHLWVKERFQIERVGDIYRGTHPDRPYVPAFVQDNPHLDQAEYIESLRELDPVTREQLLRGDWGVSADARFRRQWAKRYCMRGDYLVLSPDASTAPTYHVKNDCRIFQTVDPAASAKEGPGDQQIWRKAPSWTVISTWVLTPDGDLCWWDVVRFRKEIPEVLGEIKKAFAKHTAAGMQPEFVGIEASGLGIGVFQIVARSGLPVRDLKPRSLDKLVRATDAINRMEMGKIFLPVRAGWLEACEAELFTWTAHPHEQSDQIDTLAYAAMLVSADAAMGGPVNRADLPTVEV